MRLWLTSACLVSTLLASSLASAQSADGKDCPPGSWFCEGAETSPPPAVDEEDTGEAPGPGAEPTAKPKGKKPKVKAGKDDTVEVRTSGDVVVINEDGQRVVVVNNGKAAPAVPPAPPPANTIKPIKGKKKKWRERFGINLRAEGAFYPSADDGTSGMGGLGASFRFRPVPAFALDIGLDVMGGSGYYNEDRIESALSTSAMVYFNPGSRFQIYGLAGVHYAHAEVDGDYYEDYWGDAYYDGIDRNYLGGHAGIGLEWRVGRHVGIDLDGIALIRGRIDGGAPEYRNADGETTDTSAGGMIRGGVTFWW